MLGFSGVADDRLEMLFVAPAARGHGAGWALLRRAVLAQGDGVPVFSRVEAALANPDVALRLFGKPRVAGQRRVAVTLARAASIDDARELARAAAAALDVELA